MITSARVTRCAPRADGAYMLIVRLENGQGEVAVSSPREIAEGKRVRLRGAGRLWSLETRERT